MTEEEKLVEKDLKSLELKQAKIYKEAQADLKAEIEAYFDSYKEEDEEKKAALEAGEITKEEYKQWRIKTMLSGKRYEALRDKIAKRYLEANKNVAKLRNETSRAVFSTAHNYEAYKIERKIYG